MENIQFFNLVREPEYGKFVMKLMNITQLENYTYGDIQTSNTAVVLVKPKTWVSFAKKHKPKTEVIPAKWLLIEHFNNVRKIIRLSAQSTQQ